MATKDELLPPSIPPRSRLYSIDPIGLGTPHVESLTSYTVRLARAHHVTPGALTARQIGPMLGHYRVEEPGYVNVSGAFHTINGHETRAGKWIAALEALTLRSDLSALTLRPWRNVIPSKYAACRTHKSWCPECFRSDREPYERLVWSFCLATVCTVHCSPLVTECPTCESSLPMLGSAEYTAHCVRCNAELAGENPKGGQSLPAAALKHELANARQLESLLDVVDLQNPPSRGRVGLVVTQLWRSLRPQETPALLKRYRKPGTLAQNRPSLSTLVAICRTADITLGEFMSAPLESLRCAPKSDVGIAIKKRAPCRRIDRAALHAKFQSLVDSCQVPPPSLTAAANALECGRPALRKCSPALCSVVTKRYQEFMAKRANERRQQVRGEVRDAVSKLKSAGTIPTERRVAKELLQPVAMTSAVAREAFQYYTSGSPGSQAPWDCPHDPTSVRRNRRRAAQQSCAMHRLAPHP